MSLSYRNQSIDLLCKSTDWFLYDGDIGRWNEIALIKDWENIIAH